MKEMLTEGSEGNEGIAIPKIALSIRQPWAWLILHGGKDVENRSWKTAFRGPFLIHASKGMTREEYEDARDSVELINKDLVIPRFEELQRGGIVGVAEITGCESWTCKSPWYCGPWAFRLANVRVLPFFPCRGSLGFFAVDYPV